jgi:toxin ParE1/3/4
VLGILRKIRKACAQVGDWPESGQRRDEIGPGVRSIPALSYVIFYRFVTGQVQVLRILHGKRDIPRVFRDMPSQG